VYGDPEVHPQHENYWGHVNPIGPRSVYDEAKRYAEAMVTAYQHRHEVRSRIIRIFNTYGPRMQLDDGRVVSNFIVQALSGRPLSIYGDGSQTRSFQFVDDLVEGVLRLMNVDYDRPMNLGNPQEFRVLELAEMICTMVKSRSRVEFHPLPQDDPKQRRPDISLARRVLAWEPRIALRDGLEQTIKHFRKLISPAVSEEETPKLRSISNVA
jgi:dTDP-glucose 4,6-dehydratase